jgi:hypothetical protein
MSERSRRSARNKDFLFTWQFWRLVLIAWAATGIYYAVRAL